MKRERWIRNCTVVVCLAVLWGCQSAPPEPEPEPLPEATAPAEPVKTATPGLAPQERIRYAIELLELGDAEQARLELVEYLNDQPNSRLAMRLLEQIDDPAASRFPEERFPVVVEVGQSLSNLAERYLGDSLLFWALARYNDIASPRNVQAGQTIWIPATETAVAVRDQPINELPPAEEAVPEEESVVVESVEEVVDSVASEPEVPVEVQVAQLTERFEGAMRDDNFADAEAAIAELEALSPDPARQEDFSTRLREARVETLYRQAVSAFNRQDLDETLAKCEAVLALDPEHANAMLYRAQAMELKDRLSALNQGEDG